MKWWFHDCSSCYMNLWGGFTCLYKYSHLTWCKYSHQTHHLTPTPLHPCLSPPPSGWNRFVRHCIRFHCCHPPLSFRGKQKNQTSFARQFKGWWGGGGSRDMRFLLSLELRQRSSPGPSDATPVICKQRARQWDLFLWYSLFFTDQASCFPLRNWIIPCFSAPTSSHLYHWRIHLIYNTIFNILRLHHHPLLYCTSVSDTLTN